MIEANSIYEEAMLAKCRILDKSQLKLQLSKLGFIAYAPAIKTYQMAFVAHNETESLIILPRKNGIDLRFYESKIEETFNLYGKLTMSGGNTVRHNYINNNNLVHGTILSTAILFVNNFKMEEGCLIHSGQPVGKTKELWRKKHTRDTSIYANISYEDGEDAYMCDGMYMRPNGTVYSTKD
ncbi:hypothetical protein AB6E95_22380 [Vibrio splendidus]